MLAKYEGDWYRGQITENGTVFFIDYGNSEALQGFAAGDVVAAPASCFTHPPLASIAINADMKSEDDVTDILNIQCCVKIVDSGSAGVPPSMCFSGSGAVLNTRPATSIPRAQLPTGSPIHVFLVYSVSPVEFWLQPASNEKPLQDLNENIEAALNSNPTPLNTGATLFTPCMAMYEDAPYRGVITAVNPTENTFSVYFVDYGNSADVNFLETFECPAHLTRVPAMAVKCSLIGQQVSSVDVNSLLECQTLHATVKQHLPYADMYIVDLNEKPPVTSSAVAGNMNGHVQKQQQPVKRSDVLGGPNGDCFRFSTLKLEAGAECDVCICHVSDGDVTFYVQLLRNATNLDHVMTTLQQLPLKPLHAHTLTPNTPCLAKKEGYVYRAKVVEVRGQQVRVQFVDFGDTLIFAATEIFALPTGDAIRSLPEQALPCRLSGAEERPQDVVVSTLNRYNSAKAFRARVTGIKGQFFDLDLCDENGVKVLDKVDTPKTPKPQNPFYNESELLEA